MNEYIQTQRQQAPQPVQYQQPQQLPQVPQYAPMPQKVDDGQLELNLEPTKVEEIIILLKEISNKLTKQNSLLEKTYANQSKQKTVSEPVVKLVANK
jgi:predicted secreted protein